MPSELNHGEHVLIEALVTDLAVPPELRYSYGWVGASNRRGYVRLYCDLALDEFWDLPKDRVRHIHELPPTDSLPFGVNVVWVDVRVVLDTDEPVVYWRRGDRTEKFPLSAVERNWRDEDEDEDDDDRQEFARVQQGPSSGDDVGGMPPGSIATLQGQAGGFRRNGRRTGGRRRRTGGRF